MQADELLEEVVSEGLKQGWKLLTHVPIRSALASYGERPLIKTEYGVRKRAFTRLCQEVVYTYYVGDFWIWHKHKNYLGYVTGSGVSLSSSLVSHMLSRNTEQTSCFVIMTMDGLKYLPGKKIFSGFSLSGIARKAFNAVREGKIKEDDSRTSVDLKAFVSKDPYPDYNPGYFSEETQKELV